MLRRLLLLSLAVLLILALGHVLAHAGPGCAVCLAMGGLFLPPLAVVLAGVPRPCRRLAAVPGRRHMGARCLAARAPRAPPLARG